MRVRLVISMKSRTPVSTGTRTNQAHSADPRRFLELELPGRSVPLRFRWSAIENLREALANSNAPEMTGVLRGSSTAESACIERCEGVRHADVASALQNLASAVSAETGRLDGTQTLGLFRTQAGGWLELTDADRQLIHAGENCGDLFFLIRTSSHRPWVCAPFIRGARSIYACSEIEFDEALCRTEARDAEPLAGWQEPRPAKIIGLPALSILREP